MGERKFDMCVFVFACVVLVVGLSLTTGGTETAASGKGP